MQRFAIVLGFVLTVCAIDHGTAMAVPNAPVTNDIWDVSTGTQVTANSPTTFTPITGMFGQTHNFPGDANNTFFSEGRPAGLAHHVEWQTPTPVTLRSFNLFAGDDRSTGDAGRRGFTEFRLYGWNGSAFEQIYGQQVAFPFADQRPVVGALFQADVPAFTSNRWRAEFVQPPAYQGTLWGPRVLELDGFSVPLPEPTTAGLLVLGIAAAAIKRPKRAARTA